MFLWQDFITWSIVAAASGYLLVRAAQLVRGRKKGACGGCQDCGQQPTITMIELPHSAPPPSEDQR